MLQGQLLLSSVSFILCVGLHDNASCSSSVCHLQQAQLHLVLVLLRHFLHAEDTLLDFVLLVNLLGFVVQDLLLCPCPPA